MWKLPKRMWLNTLYNMQVADKNPSKCHCLFGLFVSFRGFGFVTYKDAASVDTCLENGPHILDNKTVGH